MVSLIRPPDKKDVTHFLRMLFLRTERDIINEINRKRASGYVDYAELAALERIQAILQRMTDEAWKYVPEMIEKIFYRSDKDAAGYANARSITGTLTMTQTDVVEQLSNNLLGELAEASQMAYKSAQTYYTIARLEADPLREAALKQVLRQEAAGTPWINSSQAMAREMQNKGITAFVDKRGRKWNLQDYCNMAVRTTARQAEVAAVLTKDDGHDLYQIVKIGSTCPVCAPLEGRIYSKNGTNPDYPPLTLAFGKVDPAGADNLTNTYLNTHPNCLHSIIPYTTIGKSDKQIQKDKDFSDPTKNPLTRDPRTKKQIAAYREKERNRQRLLRDIRQHKEYRAMLGNEVPKTFEDFRKMKYNDAKKWNGLEKAKRTYAEIERKDWMPEFKAASKVAYNRFRAQGIQMSVHALSRMSRLRRPGYPIVSESELIEVIKQPAKYLDERNREVHFSAEKQLAAVRDRNTKDIVSIVRRKNRKEKWKDV